MSNDTKRRNKRWIPESLSPEQIEAAIAERRSYYRARYRKDPEKQRQANLRYWARRAAAEKREEVGSDG